jgi:hypothetical protein
VRAPEPLRGGVAVARHQQGEPGARGRVSHPGQLPLTGIPIVVRQARLSVPVT